MSDQLAPGRTFDVDGLTTVVDAIAEAITIVALAARDIEETEPEAFAAVSEVTLKLMAVAQHAELCIVTEGGDLPAKEAAKDRFEAAGIGAPEGENV